jgi:hypothetical protein
MGTTLEVRWFVRGKTPYFFDGWFAPVVRPISEKPREDSYLVLPGNQVAGVKLRKGKYEVKTRTGPPVEVGWGRLAGRIEEWEKWPDGAPEGPAANPELQAFLAGHGLPGQGTWRAVRKTRYMSRVALDGARWVEPTAFEAFPVGARVEYADLQLEVAPGRFEPWWTIAFEPFGSTTPHETLVAAVAAFRDRRAHLPEWASAPSMGYPEWLAREVFGSD